MGHRKSAQSKHVEACTIMQGYPMRVELIIDVAAPPGSVYATVTDIANWPRFVRKIKGVQLLPDSPIAVGTKFRISRGWTAASGANFAVSALDPPHRFEFTDIGDIEGLRCFYRYDIVPAPGGSRLTFVAESTGTTFRGKFAMAVASVFEGAESKALQAELSDMKAEAERRTRNR